MAFQILSLSGGGYRGLFSVEILARLEEQAGRPIGTCFDLIAGTSIGGIIAIGLAMGKTAGEIRQVFVDEGETIFSRGEPRRNVISKIRTKFQMLCAPKYDGVELRRVIDAVVGRDKTMADAHTRLLVPSINMTNGNVQMFKTGHHEKFVIDPKRNATDVAMATSAAPFFFPLAKVGESYFADGGLMANAPDLCALHEAVHFLGQKVADVRLLSIGTVSTGFSLPTSLGGRLGAWHWYKNDRLISTVFSAQQQLVDEITRHQLGDRYIRLDEKATEEQSRDLGLDLATRSRRGTLLSLAEKVFQRHVADERIKVMLAHKPERPWFNHLPDTNADTGV